MPAPGSYITISSFPFSVVIPQADFNGGTYGGTANTAWFRIDPSAAREVLGFYIDIGGTFKPRWDLYGSDGDDDPALFSVSSNSNPSWYYALSNTEADPYYLKVTRRTPGGASDFDFTFNADNRELPLTPVPTGSVIVHDDTGVDLPAAVLDPVTGEVLGYVDVPASETGALLPSGVSVWFDRFGRYGDPGTFAIIDGDFNYVISTTQVFTDTPSVTASGSEIFALEPGTGEIYSIDTVTGDADLVATVAHPDTTSIGVSVDGTILYYVDASGYTQSISNSDNTIHAWDLVDDVALPDLYTVADLATDDGGIAVSTNLWPAEILVLPDGSVVTWSQNADALRDILLHIDSDGTLLNSYTYDWVGDDKHINHIAYANNGSDSIEVWFFDDSFLLATFAELELATGDLSNEITKEMFSNGQNLNPNTDTPFGISTSCTYIIAGARESFRLTVSEVCCPCDCPTPKDEIPNHTGAVLPPVFVDDWTPQCTGGGEVPTALDAVDPESWVQ